MTRFDAPSLYTRSLEKLEQDPNWRPVANNSVITVMLKSSAEIEAETARYAEFLFRESKWDTAQNPSSILAMANMLGYQAKRKISARGSIYISTDPRTHLVGKTISSESFKNLNTDGNSLGWSTPSSRLLIPSTCDITDSKGVPYIASTTSFPENTAYCKVDVMQGKRKSAFIDIATIRNTATLSRLDPYLYVPVIIQNCENASNTLSRSYFRVYVMYSSIATNNITTTSQEYRVVDSLLFSNRTDSDVEVYNDLYNQSLFYLKFNNDPVRGNVLDLAQSSNIIGIRVDYVESLGNASNLLNTFENFTITGVSIAATGSGVSSKLYGVNFDAIIGGADEEAVYKIKENAPKFYINNYTAGTKEAYENTISNMEFAIDTTVVRPKKVQAYGKDLMAENGTTRPVTCISFIADGLEDIVTANSSNTSAYKAIEEALDYYLVKLKSPQDVLKFVPPSYVAFALGLDCTVARGEADLVSLSSEIQNFINEKWGARSDDLDFGRDFYPSRIISEVMNNFDGIRAIKTEVEAIKKLSWAEAARMAPYDESEQPTAIHTFRIPFNFNKVYLGNETLKGFKDQRVGAQYVMRVDFMYKKPSAMITSTTYHTSLFLQEALARREYDAFYLKNDTTENGSIWPDDIANNVNYTSLQEASSLEKAYQLRYRGKVYDDNDFQELIDETSSSYVPTLGSYLIDPGAIDSYLIYFSANYNKDSETIGNGWIEMTFDPFYRMLSTFALFDENLKNKLKNCSLALLKCGTSEQGAQDVFSTFLEIVADYIDIYVSMRPIDEDLVVENTDDVESSSVLYIDSYDKDSSTSTTSNLTDDKEPRMISVTCRYGD